MSARLSARLYARVGSLQLDVELDAADGSLVLIGPNGAGKTSLVLLLLGVLEAERARLEVAGALLADSERGIALPVEVRRLGYVPQDYALFPHLSVRENVLFAVRSAGDRGQSARERVETALRELGIAHLAERHPRTLSGG